MSMVQFAVSEIQERKTPGRKNINCKYAMACMYSHSIELMIE